jgi:hypothetical protein
MSLTPFEGFLAAMADSPFSWIFYLVALLQGGVAAYYAIAAVRRKKSPAAPAILSSLVLPIMLIAGVYFAARPVA